MTRASNRTLLHNLAAHLIAKICCWRHAPRARQEYCSAVAVPKFRLLDLKNDGSLAFGLIAAAAVVFQQPLRFVLNVASAVEQEYNLDLLPALVVLTVTFVFHQYRKRQESRAAAQAAEAAARIEHERASALAELVTFCRSLANALELKQIEPALWRDLPGSLRHCRFSIVMRQRSGWRVLVQDADSPEQGVLLEEIIADAAARFGPCTGETIVPIETKGFLCFPIFANLELIGAAVLADGPESQDARFHQKLTPVLAFLGLTMRNAQLLAESREDSVRDSLTRWYNRRGATEALSLELRRAIRSGKPPALLMVDVDEFKAINDNHGHLHGDAVLQEIARTVDGLLRGTDIKCRYGGDEFLILLPETPLAGAAHVADHIRQAIVSLQPATMSNWGQVTCSIGVAVASTGERQPESPIARADAAMYTAKNSGRNRVVVYDRAIEDKSPKEAQPPLLALGA